MNALHPVFYPRSIAIVGASRDPTKRGFRSIKKLIEDGFAGEIYPVNPKESEILGGKSLTHQFLRDLLRHCKISHVRRLGGNLPFALLRNPV